jgi:hypothetical protein
MRNPLRDSSASAFALLMIAAATCYASAQGHTYSGNGGIVKIEFKSGGKAFVATGPVSTPCTYTESGTTLTLVCENDTTTFKIDDDGALIGPPDGFLSRLTQEK